MAFELKDGQGTLHKNDKEGNDKRPDYRGEAMIDGVLHETSGWLKDGAKGKWMSLSIKPKQARAEPAKPAARRADPEDDGQIPF